MYIVMNGPRQGVTRALALRMQREMKSGKGDFDVRSLGRALHSYDAESRARWARWLPHVPESWFVPLITMELREISRDPKAGAEQRRQDTDVCQKVA